MIPQKTSSVGARATLAVLGLSRGDRAPTAIRTTAPGLLLTIESALAKVTRGTTDILLDRSQCLLLPKGVRVGVRAITPASRLALVSFHEPLFRLVLRTYAKLGVNRGSLERWMEHLEQLPRTVWVHEIVHRYVFERYVLEQHDNAATRYLETEIFKEVYFLLRDRHEGAERAAIAQRHSPVVDRALAHIEANLFERHAIRALASRAGASESTLLRAFRRELSCSPGTYWRNRALDEAMVLLRAGGLSVREVAMRVGYDNPTAFGFAFRRRFGRAPSTFMPRVPMRQAP